MCCSDKGRQKVSCGRFIVLLERLITNGPLASSIAIVSSFAGGEKCLKSGGEILLLRKVNSF